MKECVSFLWGSRSRTDYEEIPEHYYSAEGKPIFAATTTTTTTTTITHNNHRCKRHRSFLLVVLISLGLAGGYYKYSSVSSSSSKSWSPQQQQRLGPPPPPPPILPAVAAVAVTDSNNNNNNNSNNNNISNNNNSNNNDDAELHIHHEVIPTLLSLVDPETNEYLYALDNDIYRQIQKAKLRLGGGGGNNNNNHNNNQRSLQGQQHDDYNDILEYPSLTIDKTQLLFSSQQKEEELIVSWTSGLDANGNALVQEHDFLVLHCGSDSTTSTSRMTNSSSSSSFSILEVATIAQAKATSLRHLLNNHRDNNRNNNNNNKNHNKNNNNNNNNIKYDDNTWYIPRFPILRHDVCQFSLYRNDIITGKRQQQQQQPQQQQQQDDDDESEFLLLAQSTLLDVSLGRNRPTAIHLALTNDPTEMVINFVTGAIGTPVVKYYYSTTEPQLDTTMVVVEGTSDTYTADMLCQAPANETEPGKFQSPGQLHTVLLQKLIPNTMYKYKVGLETGQGVEWSEEEFSFTSALPIGPTEEPFSYLVYGDQGCPSGGWGQGSAYTAALAAKEITKDNNDNNNIDNNTTSSSSFPIRAIHHFGDLSYAQGAAHQWDEWFTMIQPFSTYVPLMVAVGNHEYDHTGGGLPNKDPSGVMTDSGFMPEWGNFGDDSGGECGVPTAKRFTMPSGSNNNNNNNTSNGVFWYSYDFGTVHTTVVSSEHDMSFGSPQYQWLQQDLASVNRTVTPWIVMESHRPLYEAEKKWDQNQVGISMRYEIEDLIHDYQVDLFLAGHYHAYHRTCDNLYRSQCHGETNNVTNQQQQQQQQQQQGPMHITIGTAGAHLDDFDLYDNNWTANYIKGVFGYGRITVYNATALHFEFVKAGAIEDNTTGSVLDDVWIVRER